MNQQTLFPGAAARLLVQDLERYAPNAPDHARGQRWQEPGFYINIGIRGSF